MTRPSRDEVYLNIAREFARLATCPRLHVGAILVKDGRIIATGYNGSLAGEPHCEDVGCRIEGGHCVTAMHAEANALAFAARAGVAVAGASLYCTQNPCWSCSKLLIQAGVVEVVYGELYRPTSTVPTIIGRHIPMRQSGA